MMRSNMKKQMSGAPKTSMRPKMRPEGMDEERGGAPKKSMRPKARPEMIGNTPGSQGTRGIDPMENYGAEGVKRLTGGMKKGGKVKKSSKMKKMMGGGSVSGMYGESAAEKQMKAKAAEAGKSNYKSGGKVRGCGMARGGAVRQCKMVTMKGS